MTRVLDEGPYWLSPTKISMALGCPLRAQRRYKLKLPEKPSLPAHRGNMLHTALEETKGLPDQLDIRVRDAWLFAAPPPWGELFKCWVDLQGEMTGALGTLDQLANHIQQEAKAGRRKGGAQAPRMTRDYKQAEATELAPWHDTIDSLRAAERELLDDPERSPWELTTRSGFDEYQSSLDTAGAYSAWWHATAEEERPEILHCERRFEVLLDKAAFKLGGRIDRIDLDPVHDALVVVDYKTGGGGFDQEGQWVQAAAYARGAEEVIGQRPDLVRFIDLDKGPSVRTYKVYPLWDFKLTDACRYAVELIEGPPIATLHGCGICSYRSLSRSKTSNRRPPRRLRREGCDHHHRRTRPSTHRMDARAGCRTHQRGMAGRGRVDHRNRPPAHRGQGAGRPRPMARHRGTAAVHRTHGPISDADCPSS